MICRLGVTVDAKNDLDDLVGNCCEAIVIEDGKNFVEIKVFEVIVITQKEQVNTGEII